MHPKLHVRITRAGRGNPPAEKQEGHPGPTPTPTFPPGRVSPTQRSLSTPSHGSSSAGGYRTTYEPTWLSTRWSKHSGHAAQTPQTPTGGWSITPMPAAKPLSIRYTNRLTQVGIEPSVGSVGDSYDNALAESVIGLYKTELIHKRAPWRDLDQVEYATLEYVDWFNHRRLLEPIGHIPPTEREANYHQQHTPAQVAGVT